MVDYNKFAKTFAQSRRNMKWQEMEYFLNILNFNNEKRILDIWCGSWRFLWELKNIFSNIITEKNYVWADLSSGLLEEAHKDYPGYSFHELNMLDIDKLESKFTDIFFYASFHHLQNYDDRKTVLQKSFELLEKGGKVYMTNWALNSELNKKRYSKALIENSENKFWSFDFNIQLWWHDRYYHCFSILELETLAVDCGFKIIENKLFENDRNFITILEK